MSKIEHIVDGLEKKINTILHHQEVLKATNVALTEQIDRQQQELLEQQSQIVSWSERYDTLKLANAMLGSDKYKRETKLKINALIRDIDHCIGQLSD